MLALSKEAGTEIAHFDPRFYIQTKSNRNKIMVLILDERLANGFHCCVRSEQEPEGGSRAGKDGNISRDYSSAHLHYTTKYFWPSSKMRPGTRQKDQSNPLWHLHSKVRILDFSGLLSPSGSFTSTGCDGRPPLWSTESEFTVAFFAFLRDNETNCHVCVPCKYIRASWYGKMLRNRLSHHTNKCTYCLC